MSFRLTNFTASASFRYFYFNERTLSKIVLLLLFFFKIYYSGKLCLNNITFIGDICAVLKFYLLNFTSFTIFFVVVQNSKTLLQHRKREMEACIF